MSYTLIGGPCEGCEAIFEYESEKELSNSDTSTGFFKAIAEKMIIHGTIFENDGKTPASNTILYYYHTDENGEYKNNKETGIWVQRHGELRGWIKTEEDGKYTIATQKPASYPNSRNPAHIHLTVLENNGNYYWIEDIYFVGDPYLSSHKIEAVAARTCDSGVIELKKINGILTGNRDNILGLNVPEYDGK
ncbi:MAG: intradiol ring-cleavage dioxygenase [Chitinophagales bacterium]|nr:intradiol ring-cleavage dioxygenase [Chitinophagales bacterium]